MLGQKGIDLQIGNKVRYKNINSMTHPEAVYEGIVTEKHDTYYRVYGTPIRSTMHENKKVFWKQATPYFFCIPKYINPTIERYSVVDELTEINTKIIQENMPNLSIYFEISEQISA